VGFIFQQIASGKSAERVIEGLSQRGWSTKQWVSRLGREHPGRAFEVSDLVRLVQNVMYVGKVRDGEQLYPGEQAGIVDAELWERANAYIKRWCMPAREQGRNSSPNGNAERQAEVPGRPSVPRISRLLALALKMEQMIQEGIVKNYSELAHLGQVSTARITQVMNLLHLAPDIQEDVLLANRPTDWLREAAIRKLSTVVLWSEQRDRWRKLVAAHTPI